MQWLLLRMRRSGFPNVLEAPPVENIRTVHAHLQSRSGETIQCLGVNPQFGAGGSMSAVASNPLVLVSC